MNRVSTQLLRVSVALWVGQLTASSPVAAQGETTADAGPWRLAVGDSRIDAGRLTLGTDTLTVYAGALGLAVPVGRAVEELTLIEVDGYPALKRVYATRARFLGLSVDTIVDRYPTLTPLTFVRHNRQRIARLSFADTRVRGTIAPRRGSPDTLDLNFPTAVFGAASADVILRSLPLYEGLSVELPAYLHEPPGQVWMRATVTGQDTVELESGDSTVAWVVDGVFGDLRVRFWIGRDDRRQVGAEFRAPLGFRVRVWR